MPFLCVCGPYCQSGQLVYLGWAGLWKFRIPAHDHLYAVDKVSVSREVVDYVRCVIIVFHVLDELHVHCTCTCVK